MKIESFEKELNKYSKEAIIKAICKTIFFNRDMFLADLNFIEVEILFKKQTEVRKKQSVEGIKDLKNLGKYKELEKEYKKYSSKIKKLLKK